MNYQNLLKPIIDRVVSLTAIIILLPLFVALCCLLAIFQRGQVFFKQRRPGKDEKIFQLLKFKTMNDNKDDLGNLLPDEQRLTLIGAFVRKFSLDELPQLFNVLKGEMSLIGPRPWLEEYLSLYNEFQRRRHEVKPGITGWAQVNGRNMVDWDKRFEFDVYYVDNISFLFDMKIIYRTIWNVIASKGISGEGTITMKKFTGN